MLNPFLLILLLLLTTHSLSSSNGSLTLCSLRNGVNSNQQEVRCQSNRYSNQSIANKCVQVYSNETAYFQIKICLKTESLIISFINLQNFKTYELLVDQDLLFNLRNSPFTTPKELLEEFKHNFMNFTISNHGVIQYAYLAGRARKILMLTLIEIKEDRQILMINHIQRLTETINLLKETYALKTKSLINQLKDDYTKQNNRLRQEMMKIIQQNKNNQDKSLSLIQNNEVKTNTLGSILNQLNLVSIISPIDNPDRYKYAVYNLTPKSYYIQRVTFNSWSNFILHPLTSGTITTFTMRILRGTSFTFGICTRNVFGKMNQQNYDNPQTILYCPINGYIHANGKGGVKAAANLYGGGTVIEMLVDTVRWSVTWTIDKKQTLSAIILDRMRGQTLFPQFMIHNQGEAFELMK